jgi:hypothetical protein
MSIPDPGTRVRVKASHRNRLHWIFSQNKGFSVQIAQLQDAIKFDRFITHGGRFYNREQTQLFRHGR